MTTLIALAVLVAWVLTVVRWSPDPGAESPGRPHLRRTAVGAAPQVVLGSTDARDRAVRAEDRARRPWAHHEVLANPAAGSGALTRQV